MQSSQPSQKVNNTTGTILTELQCLSLLLIPTAKNATDRVPARVSSAVLWSHVLDAIPDRDTARNVTELELIIGKENIVPDAVMERESKIWRKFRRITED